MWGVAKTMLRNCHFFKYCPVLRMLMRQCGGSKKMLENGQFLKYCPALRMYMGQ